jgi:hypothetical protein
MYKLNKLGIENFSGMNFPGNIFDIYIYIYKRRVLINSKTKRVRLNVRKIN